MKKKISIPGAVMFGLALAGGIVLALFGGEYASHGEAFLGLAAGLATRMGMLGGGE